MRTARVVIPRTTRVIGDDYVCTQIREQDGAQCLKSCKVTNHNAIVWLCGIDRCQNLKLGDGAEISYESSSRGGRLFVSRVL